MKILVGNGYIYTLIACILFLLACTGNVSQEKAINKNDTLLEHKIVFSLFSRTEQLSSFFDIRKISAGFYSLHIGADSLPLSLNEDSIGIISISKDLCVLVYNPTVYNNTGVILLSSQGKKNTKHFTLGSIVECSVFSCGKNHVLKIQDNENIFSFGNPPVIREHWIVLNSEFDLPQKDISILKKASVLQDTLNLQIRTKLFCYNDTLLIAINGNINNQNVTDTLEVNPEMKLPEKLIPFKWNGIDVFRKSDIK